MSASVKKIHRPPCRLIGVISDTHGLLRPEALRALTGVDLIIHAGDIGKPEVLKTLKAMGPVVAVRGNSDRGAWALKIPEIIQLGVGKFKLYIIHDRKQISREFSQADFHAVISGHSHHPSLERVDGVWFVNPGSAGPRRFKLPVSLGRIRFGKNDLKPELVPLGG